LNDNAYGDLEDQCKEGRVNGRGIWSVCRRGVMRTGVFCGETWRKKGTWRPKRKLGIILKWVLTVWRLTTHIWVVPHR